MKVLQYLLSTLLLAWLPAADSPVRLSVLNSSSSKILQVPPFGFYGLAQCDNDGNLFFHIDQTGQFDTSNILKLSSGSAAPTIYKIPEGLPEKATFVAFAVSPKGRVWILADTRGGHVYVFGFDSGGKMSTQIKLDLPDHLSTEDFAVSDEGIVLLSGHFNKAAGEEHGGKPYIALFDASGKLRKALNEPLASVDLAEIGTTHHEGSAVFAEDGNLYFVHSQAILAVSQSGMVVKRIIYKKPDPELIATRVVLSGGLLSIWLRKKNPDGTVFYKFLVVNASTGEPFALYTPAKELGSNAVCFSRSEGFTFYSVQDGHIKLNGATLR